MKAALRALPEERVDDAEENDDEFIRLAEDIGFSDYGDNTNIVDSIYVADDYASIVAEESGDVDAASELISEIGRAHV